MAAPKMAVDVADYLLGAPLNLTDVYIDGFTASPVAQYSVQEYSGPPPVRIHGNTSPNIALDDGMLQIAVRNATKQTARTNMMAVVDQLDGLAGTTINSTYYTYIQSVSRPRFHRTNEDGSVEFIWEIRLQSRK